MKIHDLLSNSTRKNYTLHAINFQQQIKYHNIAIDTIVRENIGISGQNNLGENEISINMSFSEMEHFLKKIDAQHFICNNDNFNSFQRDIFFEMVVKKVEEIDANCLIKYGNLMLHRAYVDEKKALLSREGFINLEIGILKEETLCMCETFTFSPNWDKRFDYIEEIRKMLQSKNWLLKMDPCVFLRGKYDVVLSPVMTGVLVHEIFGHLLEADNIQDNYEKDKYKLSSRITHPELTIVDHGLIHANGYLPFDDEGVLKTKTVLIHKGVINSFLYNQFTADHFKTVSTGNARMIDYTKPALVRMTNTYMLPGRSLPDDLLNMKNGLYLLTPLTAHYQKGNTVQIVIANAVKIQDGKPMGMVHNLVWREDVFSILQKIKRIGSDFKLSTFVDGCVKRGQSYLPVSFGGPHLEIEDVFLDHCE